MPNTVKAAIAAAIAAALPGIILALTDYRNRKLALVLLVIFVVALLWAYRLHRRIVFCDTVLMIYFRQPELDHATWGEENVPWIEIENLGSDDAFNVQIRDISVDGKVVRFSPIPVVSSTARRAAIPSIQVNGRPHAIYGTHPMGLAQVLTEGELIPGTQFNHKTDVEIEFTDREGWKYLAKNRIDFHITQVRASVFFEKTKRL